jgi:chorismate dehydratase
LPVKQPRIGCVKYLNARPLIRGWLDAVDFDHPSALCRKLATGKLDVALVSSIEYLRRPDYRIIDSIAISADGPSYSVIVAHSGELRRMREIRTDPASETSVALLRCLLIECGLKARIVEGGAKGSAPATTAASNRGYNGLAGTRPSIAHMLIGDQAIRFRQQHPKSRIWDLAEEWKNVTDLPFVFALWLARPEVANAAEIGDRLRALRNENLRRINELVTEQSEFDSDFCSRYFRENLRFSFGDREKAGLREFHRFCLACGIDVAPVLELNMV